MLTPHLGCFEVAAFYIAQRIPITVLYRPPRLRWLEPLMIAGRSRGQARVAPANMKGVRLLYRALQHGEAVGLLPIRRRKWVKAYGPIFSDARPTR